VLVARGLFATRAQARAAVLAGEVTVVWDTRYVFARGADGRLQRRKVLGIETVFFF